MSGTAGDAVLEVRDLVTTFQGDEGTAAVVNGVSLAVGTDETVALVGESGSGKSVTALSVMRLVPAPPGRIAGGEVRLKGRDLLGLSPEAMRRVRGKDVAMIFQEPMTALNPVYTVGSQIAEAIRVHLDLDRRAARERAVEMLRLVGIPDPARRADDYPHQLSGGMRQRVMIAMALSCDPALLIADEPTTALDVTIQAQILDLIRDLRDRRHTAVLFITHDLGVVAELADRVAVMYAGRIVETGSTRALFRNPLHPYTRGLLASVPRADRPRAARLYAIPGTVPNLYHLPPGCAFAPRCPEVMDRCRREMPPLLPQGPEQTVRCWLYEPGGEGSR